MRRKEQHRHELAGGRHRPATHKQHEQQKRELKPHIVGKRQDRAKEAELAGRAHARPHDLPQRHRPPLINQAARLVQADGCDRTDQQEATTKREHECFQPACEQSQSQPGRQRGEKGAKGEAHARCAPHVAPTGRQPPPGCVEGDAVDCQLNGNGRLLEIINPHVLAPLRWELRRA